MLREGVGQWFLLHLVGGGAFLWYRFGRVKPATKPEDASGYGSAGTARFAKRDELRQYLKADGPGLIFGKIGSKYLILPPDPLQPHNQNVTVIGGSGTRKTRSFVQPNILQSAKHGGESLIVIDPKGENYAKSAALLQAKGYSVHLLNLLQMDHSDRWNPLDAVTTVEEASSLAVNLVANTVNPNRPKTGDPFWDNAEQAFITALVLYVKRHRPRAEQHLASVLELGTELAPEAIDDIFKQIKDRDDPARKFYRSFRQAEEKIRSGVVAGLGSRLQLWNDQAVASLTASSDFHIHDFGYEPTALFLVIPDSKGTFAPLLALFWQQAFEMLYKVADEQGGRLLVPVRCRMDEIANCGYIPDYEKKKSTMRSRGISTEEIWQSLGQLKGRYPHSWSELLANADHLLFLGTNDTETAQYISQKLGQTTIRVQSVSNSHSEQTASSGQSESYAARALMTPDEVMRLPAKEALLIPRGMYPARIIKADFDEHELAGQIKLADHKEYKPPARTGVSTTDVHVLWKGAVKSGAAEEAQQPVKKHDATKFLDVTKKEVPDEEKPEPTDDGGADPGPDAECNGSASS